jgi:type I restriction enzyme S subunit
MNKYQSYKSSRVEWIGEIPINWDCLRGKFLFINRKELNKNFQESNLLSLTLQGVLNKNMDSNEGLRPMDYKTYQIFEKDDLVFKLIDLENISTSRVGIVHERGIMSPVYIRLESGSKINSKFSYYFFYNLYKQNIFNFLGSGVRSSLTPSNLLELKIPFPSISEQKQIVNYLDEKIDLIDKLISMKERKISLLKEQRTSLINQVVTKGLNPNLKMKESGVEWVGEIPENWNIVPLKILGGFQNGISKGSEYFGHGLPFMNYGDVYKNEITPTSVEGKVDSTDSERNQYSVLRGDVFFTRTSESKDDIGVSSTCLRTINQCVFSGFVIRFRFYNETHIPEYSKYHFQTHWKKVFIESKMNIVTRSSLSQQILGQVPVLVPPLNEQLQIVDFLDSKTKEINDLVQLEQKKIDLLKEYRQSLISEVVTGKIKVTN